MGDGMSELNFKPTYKCRFPIIFFAWLALFFKCFSSMAYFVVLDDVPRFGLPPVKSLVYCFITISTYTLLAIFLTWFHEKDKALFLFPIILFLCAIPCFDSIVNYFLIFIKLNFSNSLILNFLNSTTFFVFYTLFGVYSFKRYINKVFVIIFFIVYTNGIILNIVSYINNLYWNIKNEYYIFCFTGIVGILATTCFGLSLFLFCMTNKIRPIVAPSAQSNQPVDFNSLPPEQALVVLNNSFQSGQISFEQYKATREEILKKL